MIETTRMPDHVSVSVDVTQPRQTPPPAGRRFAEALADGVNVLVASAGEVAAATLPGGAIVAAATREATSAGASAGVGGVGGERPEGPGTLDGESGGGSAIDDYWRMQQQSQDFNLQFLQLQEAVSQENRRFSTLSSVLKARHDTAKAVIQNIR